MENLVTGDKKSKLIKSLIRSASTNEHKLHVIPYKGKWGVKFEGSEKMFRIFMSKVSALNLAKKKANLRGNTMVIVHNRDGRIASAATYE